jgi:gag-polypeptide of LTR copia-type/Zinc knuckle
MNILYAACTENWPDGEAHLVVRELYKRYRPLDTVSKVEMRQHLSRVKMKKGTNPSALFETLTSIQNQFLGPGVRLPKDEIIAIVLDVASEEYRPILSVERRMKGEDLTVEDLERAMYEEYRQLYQAYHKKVEDNSETLLFLGVCYHCGKSGHRANECKVKIDEQGNRSNKFLGKCNNCGLRGHTSKICWEKEENKARRPAGWKKRTEKGLTVMDSKKEEKVVEYGWTSQDNFQVEDPTIWIADTSLCKIKRDKERKSLKISQPVIIRSFEDEFGVKPDLKLETPASHGDIFVPGELSDQMSAEKQKVYRSGIGKFCICQSGVDRTFRTLLGSYLGIS